MGLLPQGAFALFQCLLHLQRVARLGQLVLLAGHATLDLGNGIEHGLELDQSLAGMGHGILVGVDALDAQLGILRLHLLDVPVLLLQGLV